MAAAVQEAPATSSTRWCTAPPDPADRPGRDSVGVGVRRFPCTMRTSSTVLRRALAVIEAGEPGVRAGAARAS